MKSWALLSAVAGVVQFVSMNTAAGESASPPALQAGDASRYARLALAGVRREFPNKPEHVLNTAADAKRPRDLHPAFYGCFDWHSSVHGHWLLARLLRLFPDLPEAADIRGVFDEHLTAERIRAEVDYFDQPGHQSFERTYGWAWLLKLADELHRSNTPEAARWSVALHPLADQIVGRWITFLPKQNYPIRTGVHPNTAFGLGLALDYARTVKNTEFERLIVGAARGYFADDADYPARLEPGGEDFFSPCLIEADLMRRVMAPDEFRTWFHRYLPRLVQGDPKQLLTPAVVTDRSDPKLVHLDGLNLSRAWCLEHVGAAMADDDPAKKILSAAADAHSRAGLAHVASGNYEGEHWLATFAVFLLMEK